MYIKTNDLYLDLELDACKLEEAYSSAKKLANFLKNNPDIKLVCGASWLASINNGKTIKNMGFFVTELSVPLKIQEISKRIALSKLRLESNPTSRANQKYLEQVKNAEVKFIYSPREEFLAKFG